jgi:colicin import membrane protein
MAGFQSRDNQNAVIASLGVHLGLAAAMVISVNWGWHSPVAIQAELWSSLPAIQTTPPPNPEPPPLKAEPKPVTPTPSPAKTPPPEPSAADIALEKKKREQDKKAAELKLAQQKEAEQKAQERKEAERREQERQEQERREAEQREQERKEAERRELERREALRLAQEKKLAEKRLREKQAAERLAAQRESELARLGLDPNAKAVTKGKDIVSKAGVDDGAELGSKTGELADYAALIRARVLSRIRFDPALAPGNPDVVFLVEQAPSGEIINVTKKKPSGVLLWDNAVERAIMASSPLPRKKDGTVERLLELRFRPKEDR